MIKLKSWKCQIYNKEEYSGVNNMPLASVHYQPYFIKVWHWLRVFIYEIYVTGKINMFEWRFYASKTQYVNISLVVHVRKLYYSSLIWLLVL